MVLCVPLIAFKAYMQVTLPDVSTQGRESIRSFFQTNAFSEIEGGEISKGAPVHGVRLQCDVLVKEIAPQGWDESTMRVIAEGRHLFYVYDGALYEQKQPVWRTWAYYRFWRLLRIVGIEIKSKVVFGVASSPGCTDSNIDWTPLFGK